MEFKKGDRVHDARYGDGTIINILSPNDYNYPIIVKYDKSTIYDAVQYTIDGKFKVSDIHPCLHLKSSSIM
ncbi:MAG: hypothetical protein LBN33_04785 [Desulfovibrio sp.]|nr:hypothetical protein [Desulfovibrio sp.]